MNSMRAEAGSHLAKHAPRRLMLLLVLLCVAGCESTSSGQTYPQNPVLSGTATYDETVAPGDVSARGLSGPLRTSSNSSGTNQYQVDVSQLTAPFALKYVGGDADNNSPNLFGVALAPGTANIDLLTHLLVAQLFGQDPAAAFNEFATLGAGLTSAQVATAQAKVSQYLQLVLGITVAPPTTDWITTPFQATGGDAMFDSIKAIETQLRATGSTFTALTQQIATAAGLCAKEDLAITADGDDKDFCPASKSATPQDSGHPDILTYLFASSLGETLTLKVNGSTLTSATYATTGGAAYSCQAAACVGITVGALAPDFTRSFTFDQAALAHGNASATLNGSLLGAVPGIVLPVLPCNDNKFDIILPTRQVQAGCVTPSDPLNDGGTLNLQVGADPGRALYIFSDVNSTAPQNPQIQLTMDADTGVLQVVAYTVDANTGAYSNHFYCQAADCAGVTLGAVTIDPQLGPGFPVEVRNISFADTPLAGIDDQGQPTGLTAKLEGSFTLVYYVDPTVPYAFPTASPCLAGSDTLTTNAGAGAFNYCSAPASRMAYTQADGSIDFNLTDDSYYSPLDVFTDANGRVLKATYASPVQQLYQCQGDCTGITLSAPGADGSRTVTFSNAMLHEVLYYTTDFYLKGPRTVTFNGPSLSFPAPLPPMPMAAAHVQSRLRRASGLFPVAGRPRIAHPRPATSQR